MTPLLQFLLVNWSAFAELIGFVALIYLIIRQGHKMELGFEKIDRKLETKISELRTEMTLGFQNVNTEFIKVRNEMTVGFLKVDAEFLKVGAEFVKVRGEIKDVRGEIKDVRGEIKDVRLELKDHRIETLQNFKDIKDILGNHETRIRDVEDLHFPTRRRIRISE